MLSMKTLKVAIVAVGSALLLGPGVSLGQPTTNLDALSPQATLIAAETLADSATRVTRHAVTGAKYFNVDGPDDMDVTFRPRLNLAADGGYHIRIELDGMIFRAAPGLETGDGQAAVGGDTPDDAMDDFPYLPPGTDPMTGDTRSLIAYADPSPVPSIVRSGENGSVAVIGINHAITLTTHLKIELSDAIAVSSLNSGSHGISVTFHRDQFDAIDGVGAISTASVGGSATFVRVVNHIAAAIASGTPAQASVDVDFLWFKGASMAVNNVVLGSASVNEITYAGMDVYDARDGMMAAIADADEGPGGTPAAITNGMIQTPAQGAGGVIINIEGDTSIGAFALVPEETPGTAPACSLSAEGFSSENPLTGIESNEAPNTNTAGGLTPGTTYHLCVNVDTEGPMSNSNPIEPQSYNANVSIVPKEESLVWGVAPTVLLGSGNIGNIGRDGTSRRVTYLTASPKYNQRLIIVNHSGKMVRYDLTGITAEDGTTVMLSDAAMAAKEAGLNTIMPKSQVVLRVGDILNFDGMNRASATVSVNSNESNISVATTQVNLEDGSTDTVVYD